MHFETQILTIIFYSYPAQAEGGKVVTAQKYR